MLNYWLLVDEDETKHHFFEKRMQQCDPNFRLLSALSAKEGITIFRKVKPSLTFVNFKLTDLNGIVCLKRIRKLKTKAAEPVYIFSDHVSEQLLENAMKAGATGCLTTANLKDTLPAFCK